MDALALLPSRDLSSTSADLRRCLNGGTAFHNTNLTREEKQIVERAYGLPRASHLGQNERGNEAHRVLASLRS